ncbi:DUF2934 domain-containing protein [Paraburkholderia rhizosphaerae]|uniref:DUF2934 domain-containing protein n=1 Tax=Paraburkholderia rhizosphaerae TaxID=480658 RepID=UPI00366D90D2
MNDEESIEAKLRIRARYLWEQDGRRGQLAEYFTQAKAMLDEEASITAPIDEATAARGLLTNALGNKTDRQ